MSASRRRPDTGRVPSNRFQIFQHNEADCCPKIPLRAPLPSLSRLLRRQAVNPFHPCFSRPFLALSPFSSFPRRFCSRRFVPSRWLFCGATKVAPLAAWPDRFSIRIIVDPTSPPSIESFVFSLSLSLLSSLFSLPESLTRRRSSPFFPPVSLSRSRIVRA